MKKAFCAAFFIAAVILALEFACKIYHFYSIPGEYRPSGMEGVKAFLTGGSYIGEFRGSKYLFKKPSGVFRILAFGGSTTEGIKGPEETWPYMLAKKLNNSKRSGKRFEVINLGQCGATSAQEYYYAVNYYSLDPDLIIVYDGYNDIIYANNMPGKYLLSTKKTYELLKNIEKSKFSRFLYRNSALVNRVHVYLYRLKNIINKTIIEKKMFGLGEKNRIRMFEDVEWYLSSKKSGMKTLSETSISRESLKNELDSGRLLPVDYRIALDIISGSKKELRIDDFLKELSNARIGPEHKDNIMKAVGIEKLKIRIGNDIFVYDIAELTGQGRRDRDLSRDVYRQNIENMAKFLKEKNIKTIFIFQPFLFDKIMRLRGDVKPADFRAASNFDMASNEFFARQYEPRKKIVMETARKYNIRFYDTQKIFDKYDDEKVYVDNCHNTAEGLEIMAENIYEYLIREKLIYGKDQA